MPCTVVAKIRLNGIKIFASCLLLLASAPIQAWNGTDHHAMGHIPLEAVAQDWELKTPCPIRPINSLLEKLGQLEPSLGDLWHLSDFIKINPAVAWEQLFPEELGRTSITPLEILQLHSTDPDDGRDQNLLIRDARGNPHFAFADQLWFGSLLGGNSQAFRHLEKPPFSWSNRQATFGFPFRAVGEATSRAEIYYQLARLAFELGEDYWGWRFLAGSFHYLQDLHNPYHSGQITPKLLRKGWKAYWSWGRKGHKELFATFAHIVSNSHRFMETYLEKNPNYAPLKGTDTVDLPSIHELALLSRDSSNKLFPALTEAVGEITDERLEGPHLFNSEREPYDDPMPYVFHGPNFDKAQAIIQGIVQDRFAATGRVLRTEVKLILQDRSIKEDPKLILQTIETLVSLHPAIEP